MFSDGAADVLGARARAAPGAGDLLGGGEGGRRRGAREIGSRMRELRGKTTQLIGHHVILRACRSVATGLTNHMWTTSTGPVLDLVRVFRPSVCRERMLAAGSNCPYGYLPPFMRSS